MGWSMYQTAAADTAGGSHRDRLILEHLPQVELIASRIHGRLPENVSLEDLISVGIIGLIAAIDNFDPSQGVQLKTYAEHKIRGAILDSLREMDWAPRDIRKRAKQIRNAISSAAQRLQREPADTEVARELGLSLDEYHAWLAEVQGVDLQPLQYVYEGENTDLLHFISDSEDNLPSRVLERSELEALLAEGIDKMPKTERTILSLYYREELSLKEIAPIVGMHLSRVSQLKAMAVLRLRAYLQRRLAVNTAPARTSVSQEKPYARA